VAMAVVVAMAVIVDWACSQPFAANHYPRSALRFYSQADVSPRAPNKNAHLCYSYVPDMSHVHVPPPLGKMEGWCIAVAPTCSA
jgi:hypothetical protein